MYAKLFTSIYQGTLRGDSHGLLVFTNLIAHADSAGHVDIHPRAIADEVGLTLEQVRSALVKLESADSESRSPELEGRRIVRLSEHRDWGWLVVNYLKYRAIRDEEARREQNRLSQQRWRERQKEKTLTVSEVSTVSQDKPIQKQKQKEKEKNTEGTARGARLPHNWTPGTEGFAFAEHVGVSNKVAVAEFGKFVDYWASQPGQKGVKTNWDATWRNWIRRVHENAGGKSNAAADPFAGAA